MLSQVKIEGPIPDSWLPMMAEITERVVNHPWGGGNGLMLQRLIVTDDPFTTMLPLLREKDAAAIDGAVAEHRSMVMGRAFEAMDGRWTVVLREFKTEPEFLVFFAHELFECQMDAAQDADGYEHSQFVTHALWTEYVIERARKEIAISLQLPESNDYERNRALVALDGFFDFVMADVKAMPQLGMSPVELQMRGAQAWERLLREWSGDAGRSAAGSPLASRSQDEFKALNYLENWPEIWTALADRFNQIYGCRTMQTWELDNYCLPEVESAYREPLIELFNTALQMAGVR